MSVVRVGGFDVSFPFEQAYGAQLALMSQTLRCVARGENGLLEAPTGAPLHDTASTACHQLTAVRRASPLWHGSRRRRQGERALFVVPRSNLK